MADAHQAGGGHVRTAGQEDGVPGPRLLGAWPAVQCGSVQPFLPEEQPQPHECKYLIF